MRRIVSLGRTLILLCCLMGLGAVPLTAAAQSGCITGAVGVASCAATHLTIQAMRASDFLNTIGANSAVITQAQADERLQQLEYCRHTANTDFRRQWRYAHSASGLRAFLQRRHSYRFIGQLDFLVQRRRASHCGRLAALFEGPSIR